MEYRLPEAVFWMNLNGITYLIRFNNMFCPKKDSNWWWVPNKKANVGYSSVINTGRII